MAYSSLFQHRVTATTRVGLLTLVAVMAAFAWHAKSTGQPDLSDNVEASPQSALQEPTSGRLPSWLTESEPSINHLVVARNKIAAAAARRDLGQTGIACRAATNTVVPLRRQLPSPEPTLNTALQKAADSYEIGFPLCISATQARDADGLQQAATYIEQGDTAMRVALDIVEQSSGTAAHDLPMLIV